MTSCLAFSTNKDSSSLHACMCLFIFHHVSADEHEFPLRFLTWNEWEEQSMCKINAVLDYKHVNAI